MVNRIERWLWTVAAATLLIVAIGGITRLTRSGLSIVEWQPVTGALPPLNETQWAEAFARYQQFPEYRELRQGMTLREFKWIFFWEYLHRLVARFIGVLVFAPLVYFWVTGRLTGRLTRRVLGLAALGAAQGVIGWLMVKSGLADRPAVSHYRLAMHLSLAFGILGYTVWLARDAGGRFASLDHPAARRTVRRCLGVLGALLALQVVWGAFVAGLRAGLIFNTFPLMGGQLLPPSGLALTPLPLNVVQNMVTVQWMHRLLGTILLAATAVAFFRIRRVASDQSTRRLNLAFLSGVAAQYALGIATLVYRVPVALGVLHQVMAAVMVALWVSWLYQSRAQAPTGLNGRLPTPDPASQPRDRTTRSAGSDSGAIPRNRAISTSFARTARMFAGPIRRN